MQDFKSLKQRISKNFRTIRDALDADQLPPKDIIFTFLDDADEMATYPGPWEINVAEFCEVLDLFKAAVQSGKVANMARAANELTEIKRACHAQFRKR
jgi:XXXCH domain-containing protein